MTPEDSSHITPEQDAAREHLVDTRGISYDMADKILGLTTEVTSRKLPGKPVSYDKPSGHVRGFSDGELRDSEQFKSEGPLSAEQKEINRRGAKLAREILSKRDLS